MGENVKFKSFSNQEDGFVMSAGRASDGDGMVMLMLSEKVLESNRKLPRHRRALNGINRARELDVELKDEP